MTNGDKIRDEKLQISALSSGKNEYLTGEEILPFNQRRRRTSKFAYSPFGKSIEKQTKNRLPLQSP